MSCIRSGKQQLEIQDDQASDDALIGSSVIMGEGGAELPNSSDKDSHKSAGGNSGSTLFFILFLNIIEQTGNNYDLGIHSET